MTSLLDYCVSHSHDRSVAWMKKLIQAVGLFLDYIETNPEQQEPHLLFRNFAQRLYTGTFDLQSGIDPSYLCWQPGDPKSSRYVQFQLTEFFDWLGKTCPPAYKFNPRYNGSLHDRRLNEAAYAFRRSRSLLGHIWTSEAAATARLGRLFRPLSAPQSRPAEPPEFPHDRFEELLFKGFRIGGRQDFRGMLITILLHCAGFRDCEPFHLYLCDVQRDKNQPDTAAVCIHHPEFGEAPDDWRDEYGERKLGTRRAYLASKWGIPPRNVLTDRRHAGWKNPRLDGKYFMRAWWFEPAYGQLFLQIWERYLEQIVQVERDHPFAFVNLHQNPIGSLYTIDTFRAGHANAVRRIGLEYGKKQGTTEHGHRHSYAQRLRRAGIDRKLLQTFLHHKSIESQEVYTVPTTAESLLALSEATERIRQEGRTTIAYGIDQSVPYGTLISSIK